MPWTVWFTTKQHGIGACTTALTLRRKPERRFVLRQTEPFTPVQKDGFLYGRGTIDTKTPLFAQLQAAEELLAAGYDFEGINLYIGSSNNEEVCGDAAFFVDSCREKENNLLDFSDPLNVTAPLAWVLHRLLDLTPVNH